MKINAQKHKTGSLIFAGIILASSAFSAGSLGTSGTTSPQSQPGVSTGTVPQSGSTVGGQTAEGFPSDGLGTFDGNIAPVPSPNTTEDPLTGSGFGTEPMDDIDQVPSGLGGEELDTDTLPGSATPSIPGSTTPSIPGDGAGRNPGSEFDTGTGVDSDIGP